MNLDAFLIIFLNENTGNYNVQSERDDIKHDQESERKKPNC